MQSLPKTSKVQWRPSLCLCSVPLPFVPAVETPSAQAPRLFQEAFPDFIPCVRLVTGFVSFLITIFYLWGEGHMRRVMHVEVREQPCEVTSLLVPLFRSQRPHSGHQAGMATASTH